MHINTCVPKQLVQPCRRPYCVLSLFAALHRLARRDHLLSSYAASVAREMSADAVTLNLSSPADKAQTAALERNASMLQRMKSLLNSRS